MILKEALTEMDMANLGLVCIINDNKELIGIITDGDLRRNMSPNLIEVNVEKIMTINPKTLPSQTLVNEALNLMNKQSITNYFITEKKKPIGVIHLHDILK